MNTNDIFEFGKELFTKASFTYEKNKPEIYMGVGIVGLIASTVGVAKASMKLPDILEASKRKMDALHDRENETGETNKRDTTKVAVWTGIKVIELYAVPATIFTASLGCIIFSNQTLKQRGAVTAAALAEATDAFRSYRQRVVAKYGEEVDRALRFNIENEEIEETKTDSKGKERTVKKKVPVAKLPGNYSIYARIFDESNPIWTKDADTNKAYILGIQNQCNDLLRVRGYLFLNEVYKLLGFDATKEGQVMGWRYDKNNPDRFGDGYVDFGLFEVNVSSDRFINGYERSVILDFNIDGDILTDFDKE